MPNCKNCGARITKFDKDICPVCGCKRPLDGMESHTVEVTSQIDINSKEFSDYKPRKRKVAFLLCFFFGFLGAPFFYIGKIKTALISLFFNLILVTIIALIFKFSFKFDFLVSLLGFGLGVSYLLNFSFSFYFLFKNDLKDNHGIFLI